MAAKVTTTPVNGKTVVLYTWPEEGAALVVVQIDHFGRCPEELFTESAPLAHATDALNRGIDFAKNGV